MQYHGNTAAEIIYNRKEWKKEMTYKGKTRIKTLLVAGLLAFNLSGCKREIQGYRNNTQKNTTIEETENERNIQASIENEKIQEFKEKCKESFETFDLTLDETADELISSMVIDGTNVRIELKDGSDISGILNNLQISNLTLENLYIYDSKYTEDHYNSEIKYQDYEEKGYDSSLDALDADYEKHAKLELQIQNCSVGNEYKKGVTKDINYNIDNLDYSGCKKLWLCDVFLQKEDLLEEEESLQEATLFSMPNLETLILTNPSIVLLEEETIAIHSNSLKNIIIDGSMADTIDKFDFKECPNLEIVSIVNDSQETDLDGLKGLTNLKEVAFGLPTTIHYNIDGLIDKDFQERIDMVSAPFPSNDKSLLLEPNCMISDISAINGSNIEVLNISFLKCISSDKFLETVKSLPALKQIVGFEINNAGMCSDELLKYCEEKGIQHPFTERSLEIKHKLEKIVSDVVTEDMDEEEKIKALSEYIVNHMEYDFDVLDNAEKSPEKIVKGWGECLYYSVIHGVGICQGYTLYAQNLFNEAGITSFKIDGTGHTWNLVQIDEEYYYVDLTQAESLIGEQKSISFDDYDLESCYLVPIEEGEDYFYYPTMLPIEAEEQCGQTIENESTEKLGSYMIQADKQHVNYQKETAKIGGMIGILCALGLAKKVANKGQTLMKGKFSKDSEGVIKVKSFKELPYILGRNEKLKQLRDRRKTAEEEKVRNEETKELERKANEMGKGASTR